MSAPSVDTQPLDWAEANQRYVSAALTELRLRVAGHDGQRPDAGALAAAEDARQAAHAAMTEPAALDGMVRSFGLSAFEADLLLLCAGVELDAAVADACAVAHGDPARRYVTFGLALAALPGAHWSALTPAGPLRRWHLVEVAHPETITTSPLRTDERVLHALAGISYLDPRIAPLTRVHRSSPMLLPRWRGTARRLAELWSAPASPSVQLHGHQRSDLLTVAAAAAEAIGLRAAALSVHELTGPAADRELVARICEREAALSALALVLDVDDPVPETTRTALDLSARLGCPHVLVVREPVAGPDTRPVALAVERPDPVESRARWVASLGPAGNRLDGWLDRVVAEFDLAAESSATVAARVRPLLDEGGRDPEAAGRLLWESCRDQARPVLDHLTQRVVTRSTWDDLVLPSTQTRTLRQISLHVRQRLRVLDAWGFASRSGRGLGTPALFSGPSGTGKTLAAEILAADLGLDLYRVDLSQVVSKYIGETEKNLRVVFDAADAGGAVLLFDEADALFGKRTEVRDSHDRYANIEVSYLLQRMESFRGLAILTTNMRTGLDTAFQRRLRFVVQFPFPDLAHRTEIWRRVFPAATPTEGLDPEKLACLTVSGGTIANVALLAAFLAAETGGPVRMEHLLAAARTEYAKLARPLTDAEVRGWVG